MTNLCVLNDNSLHTLGVLDVDSLDVAVELLLGTLLVVTLPRDAHAQPEGNALDTGLPHLLVELGVEADVLGALVKSVSAAMEVDLKTHHRLGSESADLFDRAGSPLLEAHAVHLWMQSQYHIMPQSSAQCHHLDESRFFSLNSGQHRYARQSLLYAATVARSDKWIAVQEKKSYSPEMCHSVDFIKLNVLSCASGWCIRERRHQQWRCGQPSCWSWWSSTLCWSGWSKVSKSRLAVRT